MSGRAGGRALYIISMDKRPEGHVVVEVGFRRYGGMGLHGECCLLGQDCGVSIDVELFMFICVC